MAQRARAWGVHRACSMNSQNSPNRPAASCGPGAASGWYWTLNAGASSSRSPSTTPSFRLTWVTSAGPKAVSNRAGDAGRPRRPAPPAAAPPAATPPPARAPAGRAPRRRGAIARHRHREPVVVAGDLHPPGPQVADRLIDAAVPASQLVGVQADSPAHDLAAQADPEHRDARTEHPAHRLDGVAGGGGVAGPVGEEHAVRAGGEDLRGGPGV